MQNVEKYEPGAAFGANIALLWLPRQIKSAPPAQWMIIDPPPAKPAHN